MYILLCLQHKTEVTFEGVDPSFASPNLSLIDAHRDALKSEGNIWSSLRITQHNNHLRVFHKILTFLTSLFLFLESVRVVWLEAHTSEVTHHGINATQNNFNAKGWLVGYPHHEIPHKYVRELCL